MTNLMVDGDNDAFTRTRTLTVHFIFKPKTKYVVSALFEIAL